MGYNYATKQPETKQAGQMENHPTLKTPVENQAPKKSSVMSSYTCPRCHARNKVIGCLLCGWTPDTSVAYAGTDNSHEDRIICC